MSNQNLANQTFAKMAQAISGASEKNFQLLARPQFMPSTVVPTGQIDRALYQIISTMPDWSPSGDYSPSSKKFESAYRRVLSNIIWKVSPERQQALMELHNKLIAANNAYDDAVSNTNQAYINAKASGGATFAARYPDILSWLNSPGGMSFQQAETDAANAKNEVQDLYNQQASSEVANDIQAALDAMKLPTGDPNNDFNPRGWAKVKNGSGILEWQPDYVVGMTTQELQAKWSEGTVGGFSFQIDAADSQSSVVNSWAGGSASRNNLFWEVYVNGSWQKLDIDESDSSIKVTFSAKASTTVNVSPGSWYNSGLINDVAKGGGTGFTIQNTAGPMFGKDGLLSTQVAGLVVASQPKMTMTMSASTYQRNKVNIEASAGFRFGPFQIGGSGGHSSDVIKSTANGTSFEMESTSTLPLIIGTIVAFPGTETATGVTPRQTPTSVNGQPEIMYSSDKQGIHIYHEGKIRFEVAGRYHFHIQEV